MGSLFPPSLLRPTLRSPASYVLKQPVTVSPTHPHTSIIHAVTHLPLSSQCCLSLSPVERGENWPDLSCIILIPPPTCGEEAQLYRLPAGSCDSNIALSIVVDLKTDVLRINHCSAHSVTQSNMENFSVWISYKRLTNPEGFRVEFILSTKGIIQSSFSCEIRKVGNNLFFCSTGITGAWVYDFFGVLFNCNYSAISKRDDAFY